MKKTLVMIVLVLTATAIPYAAQAEAGKDDLNQIGPHSGPNTLENQHERHGFHATPGRHTYPRHGYCARYRNRCHWLIN